MQNWNLEKLSSNFVSYSLHKVYTTNCKLYVKLHLILNTFCQIRLRPKEALKPPSPPPFPFSLQNEVFWWQQLNLAPSSHQDFSKDV